MRIFINLLLITFLSICAPSSPLNAQIIKLGDAVVDGSNQMSIAFESADPTIAGIGQRLFNLHGGFRITPSKDSAFVIRIERASSNAVLLTIGSGQPYQEQLRQKVSSNDLGSAVLKACDLSVQATLKMPGFFSGKLAFIGKQRGVSEVYLSDMLFSQVRPLTADRAAVTGPSWSPSGTSLLYTTYYKAGFPDIYKIDLSTGRKIPIATYKGTNSGGRYSPDGQRIAMTLTAGGGNTEIYIADAMGKSPRRLTTNDSLEASPTWSPDGRRLAFTSDAFGKPQIYEISTSGGPMRRLQTNVSRYCAEPAWNPTNSNLIAFTAGVGGGFQIALYDASKGGAEIITSGGGDAIEPAWLNDGRHLVFTKRAGGRTRLMILDTVSKQVRALHVPSFGDASSASFVY
jgi:TolB protein